MKIKFTALSFILFASWVSAEERSQVPSQRFSEATILERLYQGIMLPLLNSSGPTDRREVPMVLNYFIPPGKATGSSPNTVPYLATTEDGTEYWNAHAYRSSLPSQEELAALKTYEDFVRVLGPPTDPPSGLRKQGGRFHDTNGSDDSGKSGLRIDDSGKSGLRTSDGSPNDTVVWRLFTPAEGRNVTILQLTLRLIPGTTQIDGISIRGGVFQSGMLARFPFLVARLLSSTTVVSPP